jgi:nucleotide-binding universal stress UspA family protein
MARKPYVIVVGTDYSAHGHRAVRAAAREAAKHPYSLVYVVHVVPRFRLDHDLPPLAFSSFGTTLSKEYEADAILKLDEHVAAAIANLPLPSAIEIDTRVVNGEPAEELISLASDRGANLMVVGTRGREHPSGWALGSVAEAVVRRGTAPVAVIGPRVRLSQATQPPPLSLS